MAIEIDHVQSGELITADLINKLIDDIEDLDARVTVLEQTGVTGGAIEIDAVYPQPARATEDITIIGKNLGISDHSARVRFNGVSPTTFREQSTDTTLICDVPDLQGLPQAGGQVELMVANARTAATTTITVLPAQLAQMGHIDIVFGGPSPDPIVSGQNADLAFTVTSNALLPATLTLSPTLKTTAGAALAWTATLVDASFSALTGNQISVNPGDTKPFFLRVQVPSDSDGTAFVVQVDGSSTGISATSGPQNLTVGAASTLDPAISYLAPMNVDSGSMTGSTLAVSGGQNAIAELDLEVHFTTAATYTVGVQQTAGQTDWAVALFSPGADDPIINVAEANIGASGFAKDTIAVNVLQQTAKPGSTGHVIVTVQRQAQSTKRTFAFDIVAATS